ncbi:MAG: type II toxin-antitoxin system RelB/DinJ family antitoxin [bacterium]|nr:type II toxin-antitoxin system RelB/DinJ family antitoxin [bacterium]
MGKTAFIRTRVEPELKAEVLDILQTLGLSLTDAVTLFFRMVKLNRGLPFEVKIPNDVTLEAMKDAVDGENVEQWDSVDSFVDDLENCD